MAISKLSKLYRKQAKRISHSILKTAAISTIFHLSLGAAANRRGELRFDWLDFDCINRPAVDVDYNLWGRLVVGCDFASRRFGNAQSVAGSVSFGWSGGGVDRRFSGWRNGDGSCLGASWS